MGSRPSPGSRVSSAASCWGIGLRSRARRCVATAVLVVVASGGCIGSGSRPAAPPTLTEHGRPGPSASTSPTATPETTPSGRAPSETMRVDLGRLLQDEIGEVPLLKERSTGLRGQTVEDGSLEARIVDRLGIDDDDYEVIVAFPSDATALPVEVVAYRFAGAPPARVRSVLRAVSPTTWRAAGRTDRSERGGGRPPRSPQ